MIVEEFVKKVIVRTIGNLKRFLDFIKTTPIIIDSSFSKCIFLLKKRNLIFANKPPVCHELYKKQFVAHGIYDLPYPHNSLKLYQAVLDCGFRIIECDIMFTKDNVPILCHDQRVTEVAKTDDGHKADLKTNNLTYSELIKLNFSIDGDSHTSVTSLEELLVFAKDNGICLEIDLNKKYLGRKKCKLLYDMVKNAGLLSNVIWEVYPSDFYSFLLLDDSLIYQLDNKWNKKAIFKYKLYQKYSSLIILSQWFPNQVKEDYGDIIREGHNNGFLMKCATLNREEDAQRMFKQSVDLITTDKLTNEIIEIQ